MSTEGWTEGIEGEPKPVGFCQHCGRALGAETIRVVGPAVYCEPCLAARLSGAAAGGGPNPASKPGARPSAATETVWQWGAGMPSGWTPGTGPNPGLAALLGFIPGVGAMYNEQYAKGIFHLMVFAVLISLSHASGLFGLMAFGWMAYMVIEAHHTARARRDGTPLPNPFGLNDLGERLGFGRAWPSAAGTVPPAAAGADGPAPSQPYAPPPAAGPVPTAAASGYAPPATAWGAPSDGYPAGYNPATGYGASYGQPYAAGYGAPVPPIPPFPPTPPYGAPFEPIAPMSGAEVPYVAPPSRFPAGAVWLIGLGTLFLLSTTGIFQVFFGWSLVGFVLIGLAVWIFLRRLLDTGATLTTFGASGTLPRVVRALGPSIWVFTLGVLLLLDAFRIVAWHRSWPVLVILAGVMALLQRAAYQAAAASYDPPQTPPAPSSGSSLNSKGTSLRAQRNDLHANPAATDESSNSHERGN